jgi:hypothetical protein
MKEIILSIFLLFPMFCFTQKVGDSIQIISQGNRKYNGSIVKIINEGYFIKTNYSSSIFIDENEIKTLKFFSTSDEFIPLENAGIVQENEIPNNEVNTAKSKGKYNLSNNIKFRRLIKPPKLKIIRVVKKLYVSTLIIVIIIVVIIR